MAALSTTSIQSLQWLPAKAIYGAHNGFRAVRLWRALINYNNFKGIRSPLPFWGVPIILIGMSIFESLTRASDVFSPESKLQDNFFDKNRAVFAVGALALFTLNAITILREQAHENLSDVSSTMDKCLVVVWKATPYLMLITNVALIILDLRNDIVIGMISLAAVGISLIDLTRWKSKDFAWYLDVGVRVPLDIATMYYHKRLSVPIIIDLALDGRIRQLFTDVMARWT